MPVPSKECVNFGIAVSRVDRTGVVTGGALRDWLSVWTDCPKVPESGLVSVTPTFTRRFPVEKSGTVPKFPEYSGNNTLGTDTWMGAIARYSRDLCCLVGSRGDGDWASMTSALSPSSDWGGCLSAAR